MRRSERWEVDGRSTVGSSLSAAENDRLMEAIYTIPVLSDPQSRQLVWGELRKELADESESLGHGDMVVDIDELYRCVCEFVRRLNLAQFAPEVRRSIRMGFMVDIVGYGRRDSPGRERLQQRLVDLVRIVLEEIGVAMSDAELQGTGDGMLVILPERLDIQRGLVVLLRSFEERLVHDNSVFRDRMRVRMAADIGPVSRTELGFGGAMVTRVGRMLDSKRLRRSVDEHTERDLLAILSDVLHQFVVAEGVLGLPERQFSRVRIRVKELATTAWVWTH